MPSPTLWSFEFLPILVQSTKVVVRRHFAESPTQMPSPFPGMDPFLEHSHAFHDFHERFVPRIADALTSSIRPKYIAQVDENVYVHELSSDERALFGRPDVSVLDRNIAGKFESLPNLPQRLARFIRVAFKTIQN